MRACALGMGLLWAAPGRRLGLLGLLGASRPGLGGPQKPRNQVGALLGPLRAATCAGGTLAIPPGWAGDLWPHYRTRSSTLNFASSFCLFDVGLLISWKIWGEGGGGREKFLSAQLS